MTTPLNQPAVNALQIEESVFSLFEEWLKRWFDGTSHAVGAQPVEEALATEGGSELATEADEELTGETALIEFPTAVLRFQQSQLPELGENIGITLVWVTDARTIRVTKETVSGVMQDMVYARADWFFLVRAAGTTSASRGNAEKRCRTGADLLFGLLQNSNATRPLAQKGISHFRPQTPRVMSEGVKQDKPDLNFHVRMVPCSAQLRYPVYSQVAS